ncbi:MAG: gliding motility-associated C-terminal domain-containing protein, partial [Bacteroidales bacterium]|nr:gliding motility-associated C-terminal domain-containing protein [Bacteroidales bacterium]
LVIQSSFGCIDSTTQTLEIFEKPFFTISNENIRCYGLSDASITIEVTGGNAPYAYILNNGNPQDTNYFGGLSSGIYHIGVYDNNLCYYSDSVTITQPHLLTSNYTISNVLCHNDTSGTILTNVFGGTPPYSFIWSDGQTDSMIFVPTGSYDVVISDANGCTTIHSGISIWQPNPIVIDSIVKQRSCELVNDGMIAVYPSGGYGSYHFLWSNLSTNDTIMNLTSGNYIITVSDDNNCEYIREFEILPNSDQCWEIWTSFSPNGDGINDNWNIHFSHLYPKISVQVFNRWGALIYESIGSYKPWDGTGPGGHLVPPATYYFVVDLKDEITKPITGNVTVIY